MTETLKKLREQNNLSQNVIAHLLGVSRQMYIKYEKGEVNPPVKIITQLAKIYKVPYDFIIDGKLQNTDTQHHEAKYKIHNLQKLEVHDSGVVKNSPNLDYIVQQLTELDYSEKLKLLSILLEITKKETDRLYSTLGNNSPSLEEKKDELIRFEHGVYS